MSRQVHLLRLPRLVAGLAQRCREPERFAVWDDVPVEVADVPASAAPVAFRGTKGAEFRVHDGKAYGRLGPGDLAQAWIGMFERELPYLTHRLGFEGYSYDGPNKHAHDWVGQLSGATRRRGFGAFDPALLRRIDDDGIAAQAEAGRRFAARLATVDGEAWIRIRTPRYAFKSAFRDLARIDLRTDVLGWSDDPATGGPWTGDSFRIDRHEDALAFLDMAREGRDMKVVSRGDRVEILDQAALDACYDAIAPEEDLMLAGVGATVADAMRTNLGLLPEAEIARYLALRALVRARDGEGLAGWLEGLPGTRAAVEGVRVWQDGDVRTKETDLYALDRAVIRLDRVEVARRDAAQMAL